MVGRTCVAFACLGVGCKVPLEGEAADGSSDTTAASVASGSGSGPTTLTTQGATGDATAVSATGGSTGDPPAEWLDPDYAQRKQIRIHAPVNANDFPVAIMLDGDADLQALAAASGADLVFTEDDGTTVAAYEIESYDAGDLAAWVLIEDLDADQDRVAYLYYGNPTARSQENPAATFLPDRYVGVWHMVLDGADAPDSTISGLTARASGPAQTPAQVPAVAGNGAEFDGIDDALFIGVPGEDTLDFGMESFSVSLWVNVTSSVGQYDCVLYKGGGGVQDPGYGIFLGTEEWRAGLSDGVLAAQVDVGQEMDLLGNWHHLVLVIDRAQDELQGFVDGVRVETDALSGFGSTDSVDAFALGTSPSFVYRGLIDEVRVYHGAATADEIHAQHVNLTDPAAFYTVGAPESP